MLALIYFALAACAGDFLCRRFYQFESDCTPVCGSNSRGPMGKFMVHVSGGAGFLLHVTTSSVGQSAILCSSGRASVLA